MGEKSLFLTYVLWLFFGWFGVHHFYLRRDRQAFIWWSTWGGMFYMGWIRDLWRIPEYVEDANNEPEFMDTLYRKMKLRNKPQFKSARLFGEIFVGYYYGCLFRMALPEETPTLIVALLVSFGITVGVHMVGNLGREQGPFIKPYLGTFICCFCLSLISKIEEFYIHSSIVGSLIFNYYRKFKKAYKSRENIWTRLFRLFLGAVVVFGLWTSFFYFNATMTMDNGEKVKVRDSINHFFKSPAWLDFKKTMWEIYEAGQKNGWSNIYFEFVKAFDPTGETNAYKVLDLPNTTTDDEIRRRYKKLVMKWHPDRYVGNNKEGAEKRFIEIQQAYEILTKRKKSSQSRNEKDRTEF